MSIFEVNSAPLNTSAQILQKASNVLGSCKIGVSNGNKRLVKAGGFGLGNYRKRLGAAENTLRDLQNDLAQLSKALYAVEQLSRQSDLAVYHQLNGTMNMQDVAQRLAEKAIAPILDDAISGLNTVVAGVGAFMHGTATNRSGENNNPDEPIVLVLNNTGNSDGPIPIVYTENNTAFYSVENNVVSFDIPGKDTIRLDEFPLGSKYPNSYTVTINGERKYLAGGQCLGFARYVHEKIYGDHHILNENDSFTRTYYKIEAEKLNVETFKELVMQSGVGAHIRTFPKSGKKYGHSMIIIGITDEGVTILDANGDGEDTVALTTYTWSEYMAIWEPWGIEYIETFNA